MRAEDHVQMAITVPVHQVEGGGENRPQTSIAQKMAFLYFVENSFLIVEEMEKSICSQDLRPTKAQYTSP